LTGGNKCLTFSDFKYGDGDFTKAAESDCDTDCITDKSTVCGSTEKVSIYEVSFAKYYENVGSCSRVMDD